ncbi:helix-turn-helix domain-containing protein [Bacteroides reticulotermitis]|nr:helix-turn-helix domain-containing protein [Bacteroides reticulotermitis]MBB4045313.1 AraC-like DNA-binding protein [Bacteroides reticulotermitis]
MDDMILFSFDFFGYNQEEIDFLNTCSLFRTDYVVIPPSLESFITDIEEYFYLLKNITTNENNKKPETKMIILRNILHNTLIIIEREYRRHKKNRSIPLLNIPNCVQQFKELLCEHYQTQKQVAFYAKKLNITERKLSRTIYNTHGLSAKEYINEKVLTEALRLLENTTLSQGEIASKLGFDLTYFIKFFRKHKKISPAQYKQKLQIKL